METLTVGLIKGRHSMPVEEYIFDSQIEDIHNYKEIEKHISNFIKEKVGIGCYVGQALNSDDYTDIQCLCGNKKLEVYVTGLTPVTVELVKLCALNYIDLTLLNFNTATNTYERQVVF